MVKKTKKPKVADQGKRSLPAFPRPKIKDPYLKAHLEYASKIATGFVAHLAEKKFSYYLKKDKNGTIRVSDVEIIGLAAGIHDIGKTEKKISKAIAGTRKLSPRKRIRMENHVPEGLKIINNIWNSHQTPGQKMVSKVVGSHHEHYNGTGYPNRIRGSKIPIGGRILAIADFYCALTEDRSYRKGMPKKKVIKIMQKESGVRLDPKLVKEFIKFIE